MSDTDRLDFADACRELGLSEAELEQLVAEGKIASVKDGDSVFFKREAVARYKSTQDSEPSILLSDEEINLLDDEDIDFGIEIASPEDETVEVAEAGTSAGASGDTEDTVLNLDSILEDDTEGTTPLSDDEVGVLEDAAELGEDTLIDTDILDLDRDDETDTFDLDTAEETLIDPAEEGSLLRGGGARVMQMKRKKSHAAWTAILAVSALVLLLPLSILLSVVYTETFSDQVAGVDIKSFEWISKYGSMLSDKVILPLVKLFY